MQDNDPSPWTATVSVADVPETGRHVALTADAATRTTLARLAEVNGISRLEAQFDIARHGSDGFHVTGTVSALVGQDCVVTLEPMESEIAEAVDVLYLPPQVAARYAGAVDENADQSGPEIESLSGETIDLGALATEFLLLGIDPYPRKPDAEFVAPEKADDTPHPFAALAALKRKPERE